MKTKPLTTFKNHFFRKGEAVRIMYNRELKDEGYSPYYDEDGNILDNLNQIMIATCYESEYIGDKAIILQCGYDYDCLIKFDDGMITYMDVRYLCLWDGE